MRWIQEEQSIFRLISGDACLLHACYDFVQRSLIGQFYRKVTQPECIGWRRRSAAPLPGVQADMVMISTRRDERHLDSFGDTHNVKANDSMIELDGFVDVAHMQVNVSDFGIGRDRGIQTVIFLDVAEQGIYI